MSSDPRIAAVAAWSKKIHGSGARHDWCVATAEASIAGADPPPWPGRDTHGTRHRRLDTIELILSKAHSEPPPTLL